MNLKTKLPQLAMMLILALGCNACTISQQHAPSVTSTVGNNVEGGYLGMLYDGDVLQGYVFEKGAIDHYNALIEMYGALPQTINDESIGFVPPLKAGEGVTAFPPGQVLTIHHLKKTFTIKSDGLYLMDREHAKKYKLMRWWEDNSVPRQTFLRSIIQ